MSNIHEILFSNKHTNPCPTYTSAKTPDQDTNKTNQKGDLQSPFKESESRRQALTQWGRRFNELIGREGYEVARAFGRIKSWLNGAIAHYQRGENLMETLGYNLIKVQE